ncbi:autotransporter outer membrane beta-barrel domain-containing protein [Candidatus Hamiltonella defensa]|uniref:autotransporter family protein n=1 Tax=Candidatus Williamhamiltonella defendens TaxID=138072 RepID=UPI000C1DD6D4|nr:autotransporter outer membrane beta-barrel domain-containing protein [Candidatus Hamiltonella defensa]
MMRYKKITLHTLRLSVLTMLIHSGGGFSETQIFNGGTSQLNESSYLEGIEAKNKAQVNNRPGQPLSLSSPRTRKAAVKASGVGTSVMLEGTEKQKITVDTQAAGSSYGLWAIDDSTLTLRHMEITLKGANDWAVAVQEGAKVDIGNSTLSGIKKNFYGLWAKGKETEVTGHQLKINSRNGDGGRAVTSYSARITLKDSTISSQGENSRGILTFEAARVTGHHLDINVEGQGAKAISAEEDSTVDIKDSTVSSHGENSFGIVTFDSARVTGHHLDIKVEGQGTKAINAQADSTVDIKDSTVSSHGKNSFGIVALRRTKVTGHHLDIKVEGQGAKAIATNGNATIHLHDSDIQTLATPSAVLYSDTGSTDTTVTITGGSLNAAGDLIVSKGGKTNLVFSKVVISPPGSGHAIHFTGTGGEVDLTLNQTALSGNIVAEGGNKAKVTLDAGSTWSFKENATVTELNNAGKIVFEPPHDSPSFSTLTTDHYEGDSGKILFHARLEGDDSPANQLIINQSSKGTTRVTVRNVGGKGGATKDGIRLIEAPEGTDGTFVQDGPIVAGSYQYSLQKGNQENPNDWYLVSSWFARPESLSYLNHVRAANTMFHMTLHERLGETQYTEALSEDSPVPGMWIRASRGHHTSSLSDNDAQSDRYVMMLGGHIAQWSSDGLNRYHLGVMGGYGHEYSKAHHRHHEMSSQGKVRGYSAGGYATWYQNPKAPLSFYVDTWALYHWLKNDVTGQEKPTESYKSRGVTASVEGGYLLTAGEVVSRSGILHSYWIQPKAQLTWMNVKPEDHTDINGTRVTGRGDYLQSRLGLRAHLLGHSPQDEGKPREFQLFVEANWIYQPKPMAIRMDDETHEMQGARHLGEFKMGVDAKISSRLYLLVHVAHQIGKKSYRDTRGAVGVKYHF